MNERTRALHAAKRADSQRKHDRVTATVKRLRDSGSRISFARVAREANVSSWLVYNSTELKTAIQDAITQQNDEGLDPAPVEPAAAATTASLMTDLALARAEIKALKQDRDALKKRIERVLGDEVREADRNQLVERIHELEQLLTTALADNAGLKKTTATATAQRDEAYEERDAARILNQQLIRQINSLEQPHHPSSHTSTV